MKKITISYGLCEKERIFIYNVNGYRCYSFNEAKEYARTLRGIK